MCVAAGYNEGCHVTPAFPTQGHIQMNQRAELYDDCGKAEDGINLMKVQGWFVHSMVADALWVLVVYRLDKE
jgi:hypothetical protein